MARTRKTHLEDLSGRRFGRIVVQKNMYRNIRYKHAEWFCRCDCGDEMWIFSKLLLEGSIQSCGCLLFDGDKDSTTSIWTPVLNEELKEELKCLEYRFSDYENEARNKRELLDIFPSFEDQHINPGFEIQQVYHDYKIAFGMRNLDEVIAVGKKLMDGITIEEIVEELGVKAARVKKIYRFLNAALRKRGMKELRFRYLPQSMISYMAEWRKQFPQLKFQPHPERRKLSDEQVREVRRLQGSCSKASLARQFSVSPLTIDMIQSWQTYKDVV